MSSLSNILNNRLPDSVITDDELERPFRNLIINGAMQVAQRSTSVTGITGDSYNTADRWFLGALNLGTWTQSVENDAPTGSGLRKSVKMLCTTADSTPAASDLLVFVQRLEGQNLQAIRKGTSSAKELTVSFWVKSNVTGTYIVNLIDNDNSRSVSKSYTISASATWEKKTITFPADTTGALDNDNAYSFQLSFWLAAGSNFSSGTLNTSWASTTQANRAVGQTNLAAATNNYWQITGVQLEVGAVATPFEFKPFAQDLAECQRYYYITKTNEPTGNCNSTTQAVFSCRLPITMRAVPSLTFPTSSSLNDPLVGVKTSATAPQQFQLTASSVSWGTYSGFSSLTQGSKAWWNGNSIEISAEL
jgi:hypothetical protein